MSESARSTGTPTVQIDFRLVPKANEHFVNEKQFVDYRNHREKFVRWLLTFGKNPEEIVGYSQDTTKRTAYRCAKFDRWAWEQGDGYSVPLTQEAAGEYLKHIAYQDYSDTHRRKVQHSLERYFRWRQHEFNEPEWEPVVKFLSSGRRPPPDFLSIKERRKLRQAALDYGTIPDHNNLSPTERDRWRKHVAQVIRKPSEEVTPADWDRVNGWKFTSLVWVSLDAGLRPAEVARATVSWVDVDNAFLRIPVGDSTKNKDNWKRVTEGDEKFRKFLVITLNEFTSGAYSYAEKRDIELWNGIRLCEETVYDAIDLVRDRVNRDPYPYSLLSQSRHGSQHLENWRRYRRLKSCPASGFCQWDHLDTKLLESWRRYAQWKIST